jgi:DNA-binding transcriptional regulator PaaX
VSEGRTWLLLAYKVPREPSSGRVYVWRKLKKLGAAALQDAVWVLPNTPQTLEQFRWLAAEISEMDGEVSLWESRHLLDGQEAQLVKQFHEMVEGSYRQILAALKRKRPDLAALVREYKQVLAQDYFLCELGEQAREALLAARAGVDREESE